MKVTVSYLARCHGTVQYEVGEVGAGYTETDVTQIESYSTTLSEKCS